MRKILMIGAGIGQIYLSQKIKERGDYLVVVTLPGNLPVIDIADKVCYENVFNKKAVLEIARKECVNAVISDQNDTMMPTVAYVAEHMGIPGNTIEQVASYCNKNIFRDNCDKLEIPVPKHCLVNKIDIPSSFKDVPFPWIVKPADAQSSVGVSKVSSDAEYLSAIQDALRYSKTNTAIVEEFFDGQEIVAEGFIYNGKYYNLGFADRRYFALNNLFIPSQTLFPSIVCPNVLSEICDCEQKMAEYIQPRFAIVHSEYLYNSETNEYRVVESALRGGGVYISSHLIPLYTGIDINDVLLDCCVGKEVDIKGIFVKRNNKAAAYICFYLPVGTVHSIIGLDDLKSKDYINMLEVKDIEVGMKTPEIKHKGQRLGPILISAQNRDELEHEILEVQNAFHINVLSKDNTIYDIKWV